MTLPASGTISIGMVAAELGIGLPLSLGDPRVLALAGKSSLPISLSDLYGRSAYTPMTVTGIDGYGSGTSQFSGGTAGCSPSVTVTGGSGGQTYAWSFVGSAQGCILASASFSACSVTHAFSKNSNGSASPQLQCVVTDNTGHTSTGFASAYLEWSDNT